MTAAHLPHATNAIACLVLLLLAVGVTIWAYLTATLVDEDEQPVGGRR